MAKIYEYKGKKYCEIDISEKDNAYDGDLFDFYFELRKDGIACEYTFYYCPDNPEDQYEEAEELVKAEFSDWIVGEVGVEPKPVCEDAISKHDLWRIIEDNAYWVTYNETSTEMGMTLTGINQALNECPPAKAKSLERHGKWEGKTTHYYICSVCGNQGDWHDNYCRSCGALMERPCDKCQEWDCYGCDYRQTERSE